MSQSPHQNSDSQQPDVNSSVEHQGEAFQVDSEMSAERGDGNRVIQGESNRAIQGDSNRAVQGDGNQVIQGDNNRISHTYIYQRPQEANPKTQLTPQEYCNRQALLTKVKDFWTKDVLEKSLYDQALIELGLEEQPDAVFNPLSEILETGYNSPQSLPKGTKVIDIFFEKRTLLILGEPGSGKTTTLRELTRDLITRAEQDANLPLPAVFHLSWWANKRQKIADWLVQELINRYNIPKEFGRRWIKKQQLLPLLDGLDELKVEYREKCILALNQFKHECGAEIVVCSRRKDYEALSNRLEFESAIYLQPLTSEQICNQLDKVAADLLGLKALLKTDINLQKLAETPLILHQMVVAYQGVAIEDLPKANLLEKRCKQLFDDYIERMFENRKKSFKYPRDKEKTKYWISWLARKLLKHNEPIFFIEHMQPTWLESKIELRFYNLIIGIIEGMFIGEIIGLIRGQVLGLNEVLIGGLLVGLLGFISGGSDNYKIKLDESNLEIYFSFFKKEILPRIINRSLIRGLQAGVFTIIIIIITGLIRGLWYGTEGLMYVVGAVSLFSLFSCLYEIIINWMNIPLFYKLHKLNVPQNTKVPNEGIWRTLQNALVQWLSEGTLFTLFFAVYFRLDVIRGLTLWLILGLFFYLTPIIRHFTLRLILFWNGYIPGNYARFLDQCVDLAFFQRVGGGYLMHRLLMEHFAQMELER